MFIRKKDCNIKDIFGTTLKVLGLNKKITIGKWSDSGDYYMYRVMEVC